MSQQLPVILCSLLLLTTAPHLYGAAGGANAGTNAGQPCPIQEARKSRSGQREKIRHVIDGDTLELSTGVRVRIIGINAPELERKNRKAEPFAHASRRYVLNLLSRTGDTVNLIPGPQGLDEYGRSLYHVQLADNRNLALEMLHNGMAVQSAVAPNTLCANTYAAAETSARTDGKGIWQNPGFWRNNKRKLARRTKGFFIVTSRVKSLKLLPDKRKHEIDSPRDAHYLRLTLQNGLVVTFDRPSTLLTAELTGKLIEVRGWIYSFRGKPRLNLHHRSNLALIE